MLMYDKTACVHTLASSTRGAVTGAPVLKRHFSPRKSMSLCPSPNTWNISHASSISIPLGAKNPLKTLYSTLAEGKSPSACLFTIQQLPLLIAAHFVWFFFCSNGPNECASLQALMHCAKAIPVELASTGVASPQCTGARWKACSTGLIVHNRQPFQCRNKLHLVLRGRVLSKQFTIEGWRNLF